MFGFDAVGGLLLGLFETLLRHFDPRQAKETVDMFKNTKTVRAHRYAVRDGLTEVVIDPQPSRHTHRHTHASMHTRTHTHTHERERGETERDKENVRHNF